MQYIFSENAGEKELLLNSELYKYLIKVRRFQINDLISFRNLKDDTLYKYKIINIDKKKVLLTLENFEKSGQSNNKILELFWCIIEPKIIEKTLPMLNQIGITKIYFIYCDRSQKNFKIDLERLKKIIINSNQQCGRVDLMKFEIINSLDFIFNNHEDIFILDFYGDKNFDKNIVKKVLIGCEGGFSERERELFANFNKIAFDTQNILKSETATVSISSKILL